MSGPTHLTSLTRRGSLRVLALLCILSLETGGTPARAAGELDFTLKNRLGVTIDSIYISPHQEDNWEEDILGLNILPDGRDTNIHFGMDTRADIWDMKIVDTAKNAYTFINLNLTQISEITVYIRGGRAVASTR